jgi:hypothetical protein
MEDTSGSVELVGEPHSLENQSIEIQTVSLPVPQLLMSNQTEIYNIQNTKQPKDTRKLADEQRKPKRVPDQPVPDSKGWFIGRLGGYFSDPTNTAISLCKQISDPKKPLSNIIQITHDIEWGINQIIADATAERRKLPKKDVTLDQLQYVLRTNSSYTNKLEDIVQVCEKRNIQLQEHILTNAYNCIAIEDAAHIKYAYLILKGTQSGMQANKELRRKIHKMKHNKKDIAELSDDEYTDESITTHLLNYNKID